MAYSADRKPGELTALTSLAVDDVFVVGDTSDANEVAKGITKANLITDLSSSFAAALGADDNYVTDAEKIVIGNTSGTNTGDNAVNSNYSGLVTNATHTGDVTGATALTIAAKAVTLAKMDDVATSSVFYRKTAGTGAPEVQTLATLKTDLGLTGTNSGDQTSIVGITGTMAQFDTSVSDGNIVYQSQALGTPSSGTVTNLTGTASININGTVGATTPSTVVGTTITANTNLNLSAQTASTVAILDASKNVTSASTATYPSLTELAYVKGVTSAIQTQLNAKASTTAPTLTGTTVVDRLDYDRAIGLVNAIGNLGATETIDWSTHTHYTGTLDSNITFTYSNQVSGQVVTLYLSYDGTAQRTITWPTTTWLDNATGAAPTTPAASGKVLVVTLVYIGSVVYGSATGNYAVYA